MAYLDDERSTAGGTPNELFKFEGTYTSYYYTSGPEAITYAGNTYIPIAIQRTEVTAGTQDDDGLDISVEMPVGTPLAQDYAFQASPPDLQLTVYRYHKLNDVVSFWNGPVGNIQVENGIATVRSPSALSAGLSASAPDVYFQTPCNHALHDERCKVPYVEWSQACTIVAANGRSIFVSTIGDLTGKLIGGELVLTSGERRMITAQDATLITVNYPFSQIEEGGEATIGAGCDHGYESDCKLKFANQLNFGGFPFIPSENPFTDGIEPGTKIADNTCLPPREAFTPYTILTWGYNERCNENYPFPNPMDLNHPEMRPVYADGTLGRIFAGNIRLVSGVSETVTNEFDLTVDNNGNPTGYEGPLRGQVLARYEIYDKYSGRITFYFPVASGDWRMRWAWNSFFCGSVGKPNATVTISMCSVNEPGQDCILTPVVSEVNINAADWTY